MLYDQSNRRSFLQSAIASSTAVGLTSSIVPGSGLAFGKTEDDANSGIERSTRVKSVLEVRGEVRLRKNGENKDNVRTAPLESKTTLQYEERFAITKDFAQAAIYFQIAEGSITVEKHATDISLRDDAKTMIRWTSSGEFTSHTAGATTPLTETERKLSESPIVSMFLDCLVPPKSVGIGEKHELDKIATAKLLGLDAVQSGQLSVVVLEENETERQLEIKGEISAAVNAVPTRISIQGKATASRMEPCITYLAANFSEEREIGFAEPGFKVTARLRLIREAIEQTTELKSLGEYSEAFTSRQERQLQLYESEEGGYRFFAESNWVIYKNSEIDALLRLVKQNRSLGQCNIVNLADMEPGKQLTIDGFKLDVQRILGKSFGRLVEESERLTSKKLRMMRVVATGQVADVDVMWINLLISNDEGRHVSIVFTANADRISELNDADVSLADTFEFTRRLKTKEELAEKPTEATVK